MEKKCFALLLFVVLVSQGKDLDKYDSGVWVGREQHGHGHVYVYEDNPSQGQKHVHENGLGHENKDVHEDDHGRKKENVHEHSIDQGHRGEQVYENDYEYFLGNGHSHGHGDDGKPLNIRMEELTFSGVKASVGRGKEVVEGMEKEVIEERGKEMSVVMGEETSSETQEELERKAAREELEHLKKTFNIREPDRGPSIDDPTVQWKRGRPDYTQANLAFVRGKTFNHPEGSMEETVENLVKTWEMEVHNKANYSQISVIDHATYSLSANGGPEVDGRVASSIGNYNALLGMCEPNLGLRNFHSAWTGGLFPWELLTLLSGPPNVVFTWRHWAKFTGTFVDCRGEEYPGTGEVVEMYGIVRAAVTEDLKIQKLDVYYKPDEFLDVLRSKRPAASQKQGRSIIGPGDSCPFIKEQEQGCPSLKEQQQGCPFLKEQQQGCPFLNH